MPTLPTGPTGPTAPARSPAQPPAIPPGLRWMRSGGVILALGLLATLVAFLPTVGALEARPALWAAATGLCSLGLGLIVVGVGRAASARRHRPGRDRG